ncbi:metallophosphoesterase [Alkalihalobacillus sp. LMS39]|uniref:metallophosphoesterase family protein n=1 Tax=Alkalihalobacillus sp. LMS39 TaxID=2924032 RepID=UPI001FB567A2|nr:metallophosphoesterase [Alkalihalobacillus sp. LMS39]UOE92481.1 metallophosphoesterase [Alkalihalobacillus sp. LMS39]
MNIFVISDTHIPKKAKQLPEAFISRIDEADLIIHAGDWQTMDVYTTLQKYCSVKGVIGNVDGSDMHEHFNETLTIHINGFTIGVVHGHGKKGTTEQRAINAFRDEHVDCIIFGHSHIPVQKKLDNILLFNPGSLTDKRRQRQYSYGILTVNEKIEATHF